MLNPWLNPYEAAGSQEANESPEWHLGPLVRLRTLTAAVGSGRHCPHRGG